MAGNRRQENPQALILEVIRMSTEDGPGLRTTVFFKGCPLACQWCHNPESISSARELTWTGTSCIGCRTCVALCPEEALDLSGQGMTIDRERCSGCGICAEECPGAALDLLGRKWSVEALTAEMQKDRAYYEASGGGVSVSGGEPMMQADFVAALFRRLHENGIHTALDTCGLCSWDAFEKVLPHADLVMFDVKLMDADRHRRLTGHDNSRIIENLGRIADFMKSRLPPAALWIRTPIIPGATDDPENISAIGAFLNHRLAGRVARWELCAFNNLCRDKYMRLDKDWGYARAGLIPARHMASLAETAKASIRCPEIVCWSGATHQEKDGTKKEQGNDLSCLGTRSRSH